MDFSITDASMYCRITSIFNKVELSILFVKI